MREVILNQELSQTQMITEYPKEKIGLLGGTFNPPHLGHLILAEQVGQQLGLDRVLFLPTNIPPHKEVEDLPSKEDRKNMVEKAIENNYPLPPGFLGKNTKPTSTTIQHIHYTQEQVKSGTGTVGSKKIIKEFNVTDWANFRSGIKWCAWGLAFMLFFIIEDASAWVFAIIPITIGAGKLYTAYQLQQADKNSKIYTKNEKETTPPPFQDDKDGEE